MQPIYSWSWVEAQVEQTIAVWDSPAASSTLDGALYTRKQQQEREKAYDQGLRAVEREVKRAPRTKADRLKTQDRIVAAFARFSATALDLEGETVHLLTDDFLPVGTKLARWARQFDPNLGMADIIQACRNAWTACGLQPLLGIRLGMTHLSSDTVSCIPIAITISIVRTSPLKKSFGSVSAFGVGCVATGFLRRIIVRPHSGHWSS